MKRGKFVWGTALIGASCLLIADMFNVLPKGINWLSFTLTALLILSALWSLIKGKISETVMPLTFAVMLNMKALNINGSIWSVLFVGMILSLGLSLVFRKSFTIIHTDWNDKVYCSKGGKNMKVTSVFGSKSHKVKSDGLRFLDVESVFGSMDLYFDEATIHDGAVIKIENVFSTTRLYFDRSVNVVSNMTNVFAGMRDYESQAGYSDKTVILQGENVFGGVEIIYL